MGEPGPRLFQGQPTGILSRRVKEAVSIPVIGNGDVHSYQEGLSRIEETCCDGVMIGRAALGNPWVFQKDGRPDSLDDILHTVERHLELMERYLDTKRLLAYIRNHIGRYFSAFTGSSKIRQAIHSCNSFTALQDYIVALRRT